MKTKILTTLAAICVAGLLVPAIAQTINNAPDAADTAAAPDAAAPPGAPDTATAAPDAAVVPVETVAAVLNAAADAAAAGGDTAPDKGAPRRRRAQSRRARGAGRFSANTARGFWRAGTCDIGLHAARAAGWREYNRFVHEFHRSAVERGAELFERRGGLHHCAGHRVYLRQRHDPWKEFDQAGMRGFAQRPVEQERLRRRFHSSANADHHDEAGRQDGRYPGHH